jgi:hypothetical protein
MGQIPEKAANNSRRLLLEPAHVVTRAFDANESSAAIVSVRENVCLGASAAVVIRFGMTCLKFRNFSSSN